MPVRLQSTSEIRAGEHYDRPNDSAIGRPHKGALDLQYRTVELPGPCRLQPRHRAQEIRRLRVDFHVELVDLDANDQLRL